jgi:hypothetical protein
VLPLELHFESLRHPYQHLLDLRLSSQAQPLLRRLLRLVLRQRLEQRLAYLEQPSSNVP